ncbi:MAG: acetyltransferase [Mariprofundales bacterium]|nr:acetyltransferase [Mariprofundales bacterium]
MLTAYDIFNGDADGICALQQLRLHTPAVTKLITGVKRDINLLQRVPTGEESTLIVLDISLDKNRTDLLRLLDEGATIHYVDHHFAGNIPQHPRLTTNISNTSAACTSLLINQQLKGAHQMWAAVGAFGDNLFDTANSLLSSLASRDREALATLGTLLNYNGYGITVDDLFFHPAELYRAVASYSNPLHFITEHSAFTTLQQGYNDDMEQISSTPVYDQQPHSQLLLIPDCGWSRRASGVYGNLLARQHPDRAHAIATELSSGGYRISVRAPLNSREGADRLCMQFPTGGGRAAAAGINSLPADMLDEFSKKFSRFWTCAITDPIAKSAAARDSVTPAKG